MFSYVSLSLFPSIFSPSLVQVKFDKWQLVQETLDKTKAYGDSKSSLVIVCVAQAWNPPSLFVAREFERLRKSKQSIPIYIVDHDVETNKTSALGLQATPAIFVYKNGEPLTLRRPGWADNQKLLGSISRENVAELLQAARYAEKDNEPFVELAY
jgi:hypothetical protein